MGEERVTVLALPVYEQLKNNKAPRRVELKRKLDCVIIQALGASSPMKKYARVVSNEHKHSDDICSGVSDPVIVQNENASDILDISSIPNFNDLSGSNNQVNSGEITSESSDNSCSASCSDEKINRSYDGSSRVCTVTRKIPTQSSSTGFLKIRIKFQNKSEDYKSIGSTNLSLTKVECSEDELCGGKQGVLPSQCVGETLNQQSTSLLNATEKKRGEGKKRNDDLHRLPFQSNGLPDGSYLAYCVRGQKILEGYKQDNGIVCGHCSNKISPSQFEAHAGMATRKKPYQQIYTADGITLHDVAISLANQSQTTLKNNDDKEREIYDSSSRSKPITRTRVVRKSDIDYGGTCVLCLENDFSVNNFDDRTVIICDQCEKEHHVGCLREDGRCDLKKLPEDKWFCSYDCDRIFVALNDRVACGSEAIPSSEFSKINHKLLEEGLAEVANDDVQLHILNGKHRLPEHLPLLSKAVYLFRKCFSQLTLEDGRDLIPLMVHGRHIAGQDFRGMYCVVLTVKSAVVSAGLLRILGHEVAELPLVATREKFRGKGYFLALFSCIEKLLCSLKVKKLVLPAAEKAKSMWVNRFGFADISQEKLCIYTREFRLTEFNGTVMLEKQLEEQFS
ncbi:hypothetical protein BVRB_4g079900 [Beta vulgaris subsp. vulgaris]|uniref:increased DNA methylation 1 isoform X1 n=1 Tax=Beta vulgaris subsp. vulgaris TaxID=3555 RepID=UPI0005400F60|nr:increased DNA methylation 1 isoform X1 [Beta vulgaris subsp. vulgaris]KMT14172.1 hypothetical protein BVRB_4g079900 [Beta vulgaris subsp. vulgaris]